VALAAGTATRETSILMLLPFGIYALSAKLAERRVALLRPTLAFAVGFGIACVPLLVQNQLAAGSAFVPGQAAAIYAEQGSFVPGIHLAHLPETLPQVLRELRARHGPALLLFVGLGLVLAAWRRQTAVLALSLPALCLYVLFYGAYARRVTRYLFVADLFAFCIAAAGVAILAELVLASFRSPRRPARVALVLGLGLAVAAALEPRPARPERLRLEDVERFVRDFEAVVPVEATVVGMRPVSDLVRGFTRHDLEVARNLWDLQLRLPELFGQGDERVLVARGDTAKEIVARGFDLASGSRLDPADYGLVRRFGDEPIHVSRVVPWSRKQVTTALRVDEPGEYLLGLDVGRLSQETRSRAMVVWDGERLDAELADGLNHFAVTAEDGGRAVFVRLVSDRPVPGQLRAELNPLRWAVTLDFAEDRLLRHVPRFSPSFLLRPRLGYPSIAGSGHIDVPTVRPEQAAYVVEARVGLVPGREAYERRIAVEAGDRSVGEWTLRAEPDAGAGPEWRDVAFVLHEPFVGDPRTRLHWTVGDAPPGSQQPALGVREIRVQRVRIRSSLRVEPASRQSRIFLAEGFGRVEPRAGRWTGARARLRLLILPTPEPGIISLQYAAAASLAGPSPRPTFSFDGREVRGRFSTQEERTTVLIPLAAGALDAVVHELEIRLPDEASRGVLLKSVRIRPRPAGRS
jgi:hypothetical protein